MHDTADPHKPKDMRGLTQGLTDEDMALIELKIRLVEMLKAARQAKGITQHKLAKLMTFYKEVLPQKGWTKYQRVNLKYEGQVIAE